MLIPPHQAPTSYSSYASGCALSRRLFAAQSSVEKMLDRNPIQAIRSHADLLLEAE